MLFRSIGTALVVVCPIVIVEWPENGPVQSPDGHYHLILCLVPGVVGSGVQRVEVELAAGTETECDYCRNNMSFHTFQNLMDIPPRTEVVIG